MPFKSKAQQRFMFAAQARGDLPKGTAQRWAKDTPDMAALPSRMHAGVARKAATRALKNVRMK